MSEKMEAGRLDAGEEMYLPGVDNGYVIDVLGDVAISLSTGSGFNDYPHVLPSDYVCITMHDAEGREFYLLCASDMPVTVDQP